jgi:hypothetical protein
VNVDPVMFQTWQRETVGILRADLRSWALQVMLSCLPYQARIAERNRALRAASDFLPEGLAMAERVRQLHAALERASRSTRPAHPDLSTLDGCLAHALLARDTVPDERQIRRILEDCQTPI